MGAVHEYAVQADGKLRGGGVAISVADIVYLDEFWFRPPFTFLPSEFHVRIRWSEFKAQIFPRCIQFGRPR